DVFKDTANKNGLPDHTFKDRMKLFKGADEIDLYYFGAAHTNGDAFVVFPAVRSMHSGDAFATKGQPLIDTMNGGRGLSHQQECGFVNHRTHDTRSSKGAGAGRLCRIQSIVPRTRPPVTRSRQN